MGSCRRGAQHATLAGSLSLLPQAVGAVPGDGGMEVDGEAARSGRQLHVGNHGLAFRRDGMEVSACPTCRPSKGAPSQLRGTHTTA